MAPDSEKTGFHTLPIVLLLVLTACCYGRILGHDFIFNWDDSAYVIDNESVHGFTVEHLRTVFSRFYAGNYSPVQMISYMFDYSLWELNPRGYLLTNIVVHAASGLLVYRLFFRVHADRMMAATGAAIFLIHPVQVETVAWISQRKNLLAMLFFLLAWHSYIDYRQAVASLRWKPYILSLLSFTVSMMAKSVTVIFPLVIILFDRCHFVVPGRRRYLDKIPYVMFAGIVGTLALASQQPDSAVWGGGGGRVAGYHGGSAMATVLTMLPVFCQYMWMLLLPLGLSAEYAPTIHPALDMPVAAAMILFIAVGGITLWLMRKRPIYGFWALYFWFCLLPVSQIVPLITLMNDRYLYFPLLGPAALAGMSVPLIANKLAEARRVAFYAFCSLLLLTLAAGTAARTEVWANPVLLWSDAVKKVPHSAAAWERLGEANHAATPPKREAAINAYLKALSLDPVSEITLYNLGVLYTETGKYTAASEVLGRLLERNPLHVMALAALGTVYRQKGTLEEAAMLFDRARELQPDSMQVARLAADLSYFREQYTKALADYRLVEVNGWGDATTSFNIACIEVRQGHPEIALEWLSKALGRGFRDYDRVMQNRETFEKNGLEPGFEALLRQYFPGNKLE